MNDTLKDYVTNASLKLESDQIIAKFESSGGCNLLKNSKAKNGTKFWSSNGGELSASADNAFETCFYTTAPSGMKYTEAIRLKNNTEYVYEGYIYSHEIVSGNSSRPLHYWCNTTPTGWGAPQLTVMSHRQTVPKANVWTKCYVHFKTAASGEVYFTPFVYTGGEKYFKMWATELSLSEGSVESKWSPHPDELYNSSTIIDANGVTVNNGALTIKNNSGTRVLYGDTEGNLILAGNVKSQNNERWVSLDSGGLTLKDNHRDEQMMRMAISYFKENRDVNGVTFALAQCGDYIRFSHIAKSDLNTGWTSSDAQYNFMDMWSADQPVGKGMKKGITVWSPMYIRGQGLKFTHAGSDEYTNNILSASWGSTQGLLGLFGDNGLVLGYQEGTALKNRLVLTEAIHNGTNDHMISWGNWNFNGYTFHNAAIAAKSLTVSGSKNCIQSTDNYGDRLINAYETAEYYFGDIGFGTINKDGECIISIDDMFSECVNTEIKYHVFTQVYNGAINTIERYPTYIIIKGIADTEFSWEIKAKRKGYENDRLEIPEIDKCCENDLDLFTDNDFEINTSEQILEDTLLFELENLLMERTDEA